MRIAIRFLSGLFLMAVTAIGIGALAVGSIRAAEGRIPIFEPTTITVGGSYVVTRDISLPFAFAVTVAASTGDVDIDLNGFSVTGIQASGLVSLSIHDGRIRVPGIDVANTQNLSVDQVTFDTSGVQTSNVKIFSITRNRFPQSGNISMDSTAAGAVRSRGIIEDNVLASGIIAVASQSTHPGEGVLIRNNQITGGAFWGIFVGRQDGCTVSGNRVTNVTSTGISIFNSRDCRISDNVVRGSGLTGIEVLGSGNLIENNVSNRNGQSGDPNNGSGIFVTQGVFVGGSYNLVRGNVTNDNALYGLHLAPPGGVVYGGNMARGNMAVPPPGACANPAPTCVVPLGTGSAAPDLCNDGGASSLCDNMVPGPPPS